MKALCGYPQKCGSKTHRKIFCTTRLLLQTHRSTNVSCKNKAIMATKPGLYANIHAKRERIKEGSGEKMRKPGSPGAPTNKAFKQSAKTAKKGK